MTCPFCRNSKPKLIENKWAYAIEDGFPVTAGHTLVIPKIHLSSIFDLPKDIYEGCWSLVHSAQNLLDIDYMAHGFNVGVNCGTVAGQTVMHAHIHLIPRYEGDTPDPTGGVRNVIPGKGNYLKKR